MLLKLLYCLLLGGLLPGHPLGERQVRDATIQFAIVNAGFTVKGTLAGLVAEGEFDPARPGQGHLRASVPVSSIQTSISLRDKHLQKPDYFDAARFPSILLESKSFRQTGPGQYEGLFMLTMKGISHEVRVPFTVSATGEFRGSLRLNRLDFDIGKKSLVLANEVTVDLAGRLGPGS